MLPPSFEGRQRSLPQRVQRHPQSKEMRMPSNTQCHLKQNRKTGCFASGWKLSNKRNCPCPQPLAIFLRCFFKGCHAWITSRTKKRIIQDDYMRYKNDSKTTHNSATVTQGFSPPDAKVASLQTVRTQLQFQVGGNPKRHVLVALFSVGMKVSVAWGISLCGRSGDFVSWDQFQRPSEFAKCRAHSLELTCRFDGFLGGGGVWLEITKFDGLKQNRFNRIDNEIIMKYESVSGLFWKHRQCNKVDRSTRAKQTFTEPCSC